MSNCCSNSTPPDQSESCCRSSRSIDWLFWSSLVVIVAAYGAHLFAHGALAASRIGHFAHGVFDLMNKMWWGIALGILALAVLSKVPRDFVQSVLGRGGTIGGLFRAAGAGLLLDLCNHGILMVGMKLYERGASLGQVFAFLIASPWNSFTLTLILISLIGLKWTLVIIVLSALIAFVTGILADFLVRRKVLPANPHTRELPSDFAFFPEARKRWKTTRFDKPFFASAARQALSESRMILRWILFGTVLVAALRAAFDPATFAQWFGPTLAGLGLTLVAATIIEVCSEGSSPVAADLLNRAKAPGNGFAFLMAGASTDYTEIMALRETTRSWKLSLALPILTLPQIVAISWLLNQFS